MGRGPGVVGHRQHRRVDSSGGFASVTTEIELKRSRILAGDTGEVSRGAVDQQLLAGDSRRRLEGVHLDGYRHWNAVEEGIDEVVWSRVKIPRHRRTDQSQERRHG